MFFKKCQERRKMTLNAGCGFFFGRVINCSHVRLKVKQNCKKRCERYISRDIDASSLLILDGWDCEAKMRLCMKMKGRIDQWN